MNNRFEQLRYKDKLSLDPEISMSQLAKEMEISKATISKLEHDENYDARISIIKKYKERFPDVSYDYLFGATGTKHKQYSKVEEEFPFSNEFYNNLKKLCETRGPVGLECDPEVELIFGIREFLPEGALEHLLEALFHNPDELHIFIKELFYSMAELYKIDHPDFSKTLLTSYDENPYTQEKEDYNRNLMIFRITQATITFLVNNVAPFLERYLKHYIKEEARVYKESMEKLDPYLPFHD